MTRSEILALAIELGWYALEREQFNDTLLYRPSLPAREEYTLDDKTLTSGWGSPSCAITDDGVVRSFLQPRGVPTGPDLAKGFIERYGSYDGAHHKQWVLDQVMRALLNCPHIITDSNGYFHMDQGESPEYKKWCEDMRGEWDPEYEEYEYGEWDTGIG